MRNDALTEYTLHTYVNKPQKINEDQHINHSPSLKQQQQQNGVVAHALGQSDDELEREFE